MLNRVASSVLVIGLAGRLWGAATPAAGDVTISSDEMELQDHGNKTIFQGHVALRGDSYVLKANRMTRTQKTDVVEAQGRVQGTWNQPGGGTARAAGEF